VSDLFDGSNTPPEQEPGRIELADRDLDGARLVRLSCRDAELSGCIATGLSVTDTNAEGARFADMRLVRAAFEDVNLSGATFRDVDMTGVAVADARLEGMTIDGILVTDLLARWRDG
jgi:uncharacterized protein YjbI with pentapeptide repeats